MKTMKLTAIGQMEMFDVPEPRITRGNDILIKLSRVGVCGSDVHYYTSGRIGSQVVTYPYTVGHESAGIVAEVGAEVTDLKPGDPIAVDPAIPCSECDQCKAGRPHTCRNLKFLGCPGQAEGSLSEFLVMPRESCHLMGKDTPLDLGVVSEPLAIGVYACQLAGNLGGAKVGILGFGPIGMSVLLSARLYGVESVYVTDKVDTRLEHARNAGANWMGNPDSEDIIAGISQAEPLLLDYVFECCGQQDALDQAIEVLKPGGSLLIIGIPNVDRVSFNMDKLRRKEIRIQNVRRQNACTRPAIDMMESGKTDAGIMVTHHFPFELCKEAFDLVKDYRDGVMKAIITFD